VKPVAGRATAVSTKGCSRYSSSLTDRNSDDGERRSPGTPLQFAGSFPYGAALHADTARVTSNDNARVRTFVRLLSDGHAIYGAAQDHPVTRQPVASLCSENAIVARVSFFGLPCCLNA